MNADERVPASYGRSPSAEDHLKRIDLNGRYHISVIQDIGMEIRLMEGRQPIQFTDLDRKYSDGIQGFILAYGGFFQPNYDEVRPAVETEEAVLTAHHFELLNDDAVVGKMRFELNQFGELLSIKVQAIQKP